MDNTFAVFKSYNDILYIIYTNNQNSIIAYNLIKKKIVIEIKRAHKEIITNYRHNFDRINERDLIISISSFDNNIKLWNVDNWECLYNFQKIYVAAYLYSACFMTYKIYNYIITSKNNPSSKENIKVFDFKGNKIKEINNSFYDTYFIDTYYDNILDIHFIIQGNSGNVISYDYFNNKIYKIYEDDNNKKDHCSVIINKRDNIIQLIESCDDGNIRIWNFHSGQLLHRVKIVNYRSLYGICLWNSEYMFVGCEDETIKLIELKEVKVVNSLKGHNRNVLTIKKISHPIYGECLISQNVKNSEIKLWIDKQQFK